MPTGSASVEADGKNDLAGKVDIMNPQDGVFTLYPKVVPDRKAIGILITRGGAERFDLFPLNGRNEGRAVEEEVAKILHRRAGPPSGQIIRLPGETMIALSRKDLGYQFRPMGDTELDWHESLFEDWSSRHEPRDAETVPARTTDQTPVHPPVREEPEKPQPAAVSFGQADACPPPSMPAQSPVAFRQASAQDTRSEDIESVRLLLRSLLREAAAEETNAEIAMLRREIAQFSSVPSQLSSTQEALKARLDLISQRLLSIERDRLDIAGRFDTAEKILRDISVRVSAFQPERKKSLVLKIAQAVLSTILISLLCLTFFLAGIAMSKTAGDFLRGRVLTPEHLKNDPAHSGADWAGISRNSPSERLTQNQAD